MKAQKLRLAFNSLSIIPLLLVVILSSCTIITSGQLNYKINDTNFKDISCTVGGVKQTTCNGCGSVPTPTTGSNNAGVRTSINFGCQGQACANGGTTGYCSKTANGNNGITDLLFAVIRFLSAGVGLVVIASVIVGGIQYIVSRGDPNATGAAIKRLTSSVIALLVFIFAYAILNFLIPGGFFN